MLPREHNSIVPHFWESIISTLYFWGSMILPFLGSMNSWGVLFSLPILRGAWFLHGPHFWGSMVLPLRSMTIAPYSWELAPNMLFILKEHHFLSHTLLIFIFSTTNINGQNFIETIFYDSNIVQPKFSSSHNIRETYILLLYQWRDIFTSTQFNWEENRVLAISRTWTHAL